MDSISPVITILLLAANRVESASNWTYDVEDAHIGPIHWADQYQVCNQRMQSPIDIQTDDVVVVEYENFNFTGYDGDGENPGIVKSITNVGHTASLSFDGFVGLSGGGLPTEYEAVQAHFHWGISNNVGSEHKVDGKQFPLEMHIVHYAYKWFNGSFPDAVKSGNHQALAVLGVLFELGEEDNPKYKEVITGISNVESQDAKYTFQNRVPLADLLPEDTSLFYRYNGSLTTPDCEEVVTWTVFGETVKLSENQLENFRNIHTELKGHAYVTGNTFRPTQSIGGRTVYYSSVTNLQALRKLVIVVAVLQGVHFLIGI